MTPADDVILLDSANDRQILVAEKQSNAASRLDQSSVWLQQEARFCSHASNVLALGEDNRLIQVQGLECPRLPLLSQHRSQSARGVAKGMAACTPYMTVTLLQPAAALHGASKASSNSINSQCLTEASSADAGCCAQWRRLIAVLAAEHHMV